MGCLTLFADFIADQRASSRAAHGSQRAAKDGVSGHATEYSASARTDLRIGWVGAAAGQGNQGSGGNGHQDFRIHNFTF